MEVASLRHSMATNERGGASKTPLSMFTSLDFAHNTQELESAVESDKLTAEAYQRVREEMRDYLSVPSQRLAHVGKRKRQRQLTEKLVCEVRKELRNRPAVVEKIVERICSRDQLQQKAFEQTMEGLREKRISLAQELTTRLGEIEGLTKSLLIKPIYGSRSQSRHQDLITPLPRPVPHPQHSGHTHKPQIWTGSAMVGSYHTHKHLNCHPPTAYTPREGKGRH